MTRLYRAALTAAPAFVLAVPGLSGAALAHTGLHAEAGGTAGLAQGFLHPWLGADHVLAMAAVGLIAALRGGRALWALPAAFLALMGVGAGLGPAGVALPHVEAMIGLSVVAFGLAAIVGARAPVAGLAALVGGFAVFHGFAHAAEMPETASGAAYGSGFLLGTALLHAAGIGLGLLGVRAARDRAAPALGALVAASGAALLALG